MRLGFIRFTSPVVLKYDPGALTGALQEILQATAERVHRGQYVANDDLEKQITAELAKFGPDLEFSYVAHPEGYPVEFPAPGELVDLIIDSTSSIRPLVH